MSSLVQRIGQQAADAIEAFKNAARDFTTEYTWLQNNPPPFVVAPEIMREYESLLSRSRVIGGTLQTVTRAIDAVIGTVWRGSGVDVAGLALGAFPVIPVALIAGGTATLIAGINAIRQFRERLKVYETLTRDGTAPSVAWREAARVTSTPGVFENITTNVAVIAGGVVLLYLLMRSK